MNMRHLKIMMNSHDDECHGVLFFLNRLKKLFNYVNRICYHSFYYI